jgi:hypothetical protein
MSDRGKRKAELRHDHPKHPVISPDRPQEQTGLMLSVFEISSCDIIINLIIIVTITTGPGKMCAPY